MSKQQIPRIIFASTNSDDDENEYLLLKSKYNIGDSVQIKKLRRQVFEFYEDNEKRFKYGFDDAVIIDRWERFNEGNYYRIRFDKNGSEQWVEETSVKPKNI